MIIGNAISPVNGFSFSSGGGDNLKFTVDTTNAGSASNTFILKCGSAGTYNAVLTTDEGHEQAITSFNDSNLTVVFSTPGIHKIEVSGDLPWIYLDTIGDDEKWISIEQWGVNKWNNWKSMLDGASNFTTISATDKPDCSEVTEAAEVIKGTSLTALDLSGTSFDICTTFLEFAYLQTSIVTIDLSSVYMPNAVSMTRFARGCSSLTTVDFSGCDMSSLSSMFHKYTLCTSLSSVDYTGVTFRSAGVDCTGFFDSAPVATVTGLFNNATFKPTVMQSLFQDSSYNSSDPKDLDISLLTSAVSVFKNSGMSTANYTDVIVGWANFVFDNAGSPASVSMTQQTGRTFDTSRGGGVNFTDAGDARDYLTGVTSSLTWTISGDSII